MARRNKFEAPRATEKAYERQLRKVARVVGDIVEPYLDGSTIPDLPRMLTALRNYADALGPWATRQAEDMLRKVSSHNRRAWLSDQPKFNKAYRATRADTAAGREAARLLNEQVTLIKSLPLKAGERAQQLATEGTSTGRRAEEVAQELLRTGEVTQSRAMLIARTEIAKANSTLTQARSQAVGSSSYIWRTAGDEAVRESHAEMEGQVVRWDSPPTLSDGTTTHAGQIYNCRCFAEPIFTDLVD